MKTSAGVLAWRRTARGVEVLLGHPGGPYFARRDHGVWTIPKGEVGAAADLEAEARREFEEETGFALDVELLGLGAVRQRGGKVVHAFAGEIDVDPVALVSNRFEIEWPPRSGRRQSFPELDRVAWFTLEEARERILPAQAPLLDRLAAHLGA